MNAPFAPPVNGFARETSVARYLRELFASLGNREEHFCAIFLDRRRRFLGDRVVRGGGSTFMRLRAREVLAEALALEADGLIVAHNHPSGLCRPSRHDVTATRKLSEIARALDIELLDHLIITENHAYSMRNREEI